MNIDEIFQEIRTPLKEAQENTVDDPWEYIDDDLLIYVQSALRQIRATGLVLESTIQEDGTLDPQPSEAQGVLISLHVADSVLSGDLTKKLRDGELGLMFRSASDVIDTKTAAIHFTKSSERIMSRFEILLTRLLSLETDATSAVFGEQTLSTVS